VDVFFLHRNTLHYSVIITQSKRDKKLIARVTNALRFTLLELERERIQARLVPSSQAPSDAGSTGALQATSAAFGVKMTTRAVSELATR
jgi:hypothetical protein